MERTSTRVTQLLRDWEAGEDGAFDALIPLVYDELRRMASLALRAEGQGHTLRTTALVSEAYLRLVSADVHWDGSRHFMRVAARAMRRVLVDHARRRLRKKRGDGVHPVGLDTLEPFLADPGRPEILLDLDEALDGLMALDERKGRVIELHYFGGLSYDEVARALDISPATVHRDLRMARAWLAKELSDDGRRQCALPTIGDAVRRDGGSAGG